MSKNLCSTLVLLSLSACALGPNYQRPNIETPASWNTPTTPTAQLTISKSWWKNFGDEQLNQMIKVALSNNQNLAAAIARVDEAAALAKISRSSLLPAINANGSYQRARISQETNPIGTPLVSDLRDANVSLSWELDLWGKLRRRYEASKANFRASKFEYYAARLSITAQLTQTYFQLRALDAELAVAKRTLAGRDDSLDLQTKRYNGGLISALDLNQAKAEAAIARADVPRYQRAVLQTEHALSILLGRSPRQMMNKLARGKAIKQIQLPLLIPDALPSELLTRRADIAAAEQQLIAANAKIGEARAAYFPDISLTSALGSQSLSLESLFSGPARTWSFVGDLAAPIFNFGATGYAVDAATAMQKQALANYQSVIQNAFREALDALSSQKELAAEESAWQQNLDANINSVRLAGLRYDNGYSSYIDLLDAERGEYQAELSLISSRQARLNTVVELYKALGGGWNINQEKETSHAK